MITLITSCNRHELLQQTIDSLLKDQKQKLAIAINEDGPSVMLMPAVPGHMINTYKLDGKGQHHSIGLFIFNASKNKHRYYLHLEDDWLFDNSYDWIMESVKILQSDPMIIKVLCRSDSPHPVVYDRIINKSGQQIKLKDEYLDDATFGILEPWTDLWKGHIWHGFSWNPGVTRLDLMPQFLPLPETEQQVAEQIYLKEYKIAVLRKGVCAHIGENKSTHTN